MSDVTPERIILQTEEVSYRAAVSEATFTRVAATNNFISTYQYDTKAFYLNGRYFGKAAPQTGVDGAHIMIFNMEIIGISMFNLVAGASGTTTLDVKRRTASGGSGTSIFSTKPSIASTAGNNAWVSRVLVPADTILENPSGTTAPVLSTTTLNAGDMITLDTFATQTGAENCGLILYLRPIN